MNHPKKQRAEELTEEQCQPKLVNHGCEQHNYRMLFCRLTPELSRPVAGRRTCASVAHSTRPTPRHGVGLNELLGGGGCRCKSGTDALAERRSGKVRARTCELSAGCNRSDRVSSGPSDHANHRFRSWRTQRMRRVSAPDGLDRRSNAARSRPKSNANRSREKEHWKAKPSNAFLPPNA